MKKAISTLVCATFTLCVVAAHAAEPDDDWLSSPDAKALQPPCGAVIAHGWIVGDGGFGVSPTDLIERTRHSKAAEQQLMRQFPFVWHSAQPLPFCTGVADVNSVRIVTLRVNQNLLTRYGPQTLKKYLYGIAQIPMSSGEAQCAVLTPRETAKCTADR